MAALPDFGISLGGGVGVGIGIPTGGARAEGRPAGAGTGAEKRPRAPTAPPAASAGEAPCTEEPTKPALRDGAIRAQYSDEARSANVEGKVRMEVTINAEGDVTGVRVLEGLGHGLDEAAIVAAKHQKFRPITRCGKAVAAPKPFVYSQRFTLAD
jgi:protein TonB